MPAFARRLLLALQADAAALAWLTTHAAVARNALKTLAAFHHQGGVTIEVPPGRPIITTLIQPDGDVVVRVSRCRLDAEEAALTPDARAAWRAELIGRHQQAMSARLPALDPAFAARFSQAVSALRHAAWAATPVLATGTGGTSLLVGLDWLHLAGALIPSALPIALRYATPPLVHYALNHAFRRNFAPEPSSKAALV